MEITFRSASLRTACNSDRKGLRKFGAARFRILKRRLDQLTAADSLSDVPPSARCHELKGDRAGQLAVMLDGGWRLVFEPFADPGGAMDWSKITIIEIVEVTNYHD